MGSGTGTYGSMSSLTCQKVSGRGNSLPLIYFLILISLIVGAAVLYLNNRHKTRVYGYQIMKKSLEIKKLTSEREQLEAQLAQAKNYERIIRIAETELGMVWPDAEMVHVINNCKRRDRHK